MKRILSIALVSALLFSSIAAKADSLGSAVGGSAGNQSNMAGGLCLTSPAVLSNGQQRALLVDCTTGALITVPASGTTQPVTGNVGGYEFNSSVIPTVQNAAYAAGQSLGGLQTISVGSTNSLSGILTQASISSTGGSTVAVVMYVWDKNPTGTTCTDKTNFVKSQTDNQHLITGSPILLTPALVVSAQDTSTYASAGNLVDNFVNSSANTNLYVCVLANAAVTPGTTSDYRLNLQGIKDQP